MKRIAALNQKEDKKVVSCFDKWAKIIGLVGGGWAILASIVGGIFFLIDRFDKPDLKIQGVVPIVNWKRSETNDSVNFHGIALIAHLQM